MLGSDGLRRSRMGRAGYGSGSRSRRAGATVGRPRRHVLRLDRPASIDDSTATTVAVVVNAAQVRVPAAVVADAVRDAL